MSKLNANAFSFVPGQFRLPQQPQQPAQPPPPPIERPPQTEAPPPPPTISLNIGGAKPAPPPAAGPSPPATISLNIGGSKPATPAPSAPSAPAPARAPPKVDTPAYQPAKATPAPTVSVSNAAGSKSFTLERAKTDSTAIAQEVRNAVDEEVLKDLYGNGECCLRSAQHLSSEHDFPPISQGAPKHRLHRSR